MGVGTSQATSTIAQISVCVPKGVLACADVDPISPAQSAGLRAGDQILAFNGAEITNWSKDVEIIRNSPGKAITLTVKRDGKIFDISIVPAVRIIDGEKYGFLGVVNTYGIVKSSPIKSFEFAGKLSKEFLTSSVTSIASLPSKIPALWGATVSGDERDPNGLVGIVGVAQVSGQTIGSNALSVKERLATFLLLIASLNFFVGVFNLLPILPLDGGHMAIAILDEVRALFARIRKRPRPSPINVNSLAPVTMLVFILLAALTVLLLAADIINPVHLNL